jgi:hypothetical protein
VLHHADLLVGGTAMVSMYGGPGFAHAPLTGLLCGYFAAQGLSAGGLILWRATVIDLPEAWASSSADGRLQHPVAVASSAAPTGLAAARLMMAAAMLYMLAAA